MTPTNILDIGAQIAHKSLEPRDQIETKEESNVSQEAHQEVARQG